jgi:hypothetical protein
MRELERMKSNLELRLRITSNIAVNNFQFSNIFISERCGCQEKLVGTEPTISVYEKIGKIQV